MMSTAFYDCPIADLNMEGALRSVLAGDTSSTTFYIRNICSSGLSIGVMQKLRALKRVAARENLPALDIALHPFLEAFEDQLSSGESMLETLRYMRQFGFNPDAAKGTVFLSNVKGV